MTPLEKKPSNRPLQWAVILTLTLLVVFGGAFLLEFVVASERPAVTPESLTAESYMAEVNALLANGDATRGETLIREKYECHVCHIEGAGKIAPDFTGVAERAANAHPPLQAPAYLYESIIQPLAHIVEDFSGAMPANYRSRLSDQELGDIIAYLLTQ